MPTIAQRKAMARFAGARRFVWNWALERRLSEYRDHGRSIGPAQLSRELTALKRAPGFEWLSEIDAQVLQQGLRDLHRAFESFFARKTGFPRFKSKKADAARFRFPQRVRIEESHAYLPKIGWVRVRLSRAIPRETGSATVRRDAGGRWFLTVIVRVPKAPLSPGPYPRPVGADAGIRNLLVLSDGRRVDNPRWSEQSRRRLRRAHRRLSRTQRGSRRRARARRALGIEYQRVANRRQDFLHKLTTGLVRDYDLISIEDLGVTGMVRTKLSGQLQDAALRELRKQLQYKGETAGVPVIVVNRFFPSSKLCSSCGRRLANLPLRQREWSCVCGAVNDRDLNAAQNLLAEGLRVHNVAAGRADTRNARGARVSLPMEAAGNEA